MQYSTVFSVLQEKVTKKLRGFVKNLQREGIADSAEWTVKYVILLLPTVNSGSASQQRLCQLLRGVIGGHLGVVADPEDHTVPA